MGSLMENLKLSVSCLFAVALAGLGGCTILPTYQAPATEQSVPVKLLGLGLPTMCKDGVEYLLPISQGEPRFVMVPIGQRIGFGVRMEFRGYNTVYNCKTELSFIPNLGEVYLFGSGLLDTPNSGQTREHCFIELVKEDVSKETGVVPEPSVGAALCNHADKDATLS
jgi:hypothetical protein